MVTQSILHTLKYSDHFGFPLTLDEIYTRLVGASPCGRPQITTAINLMLKAKTVFQTGHYYHLPSRSSLVPRRLKRAQLSAPQLTRAKELAAKLGHVPYVLAIYLTGSLAMNNSNGDSDIDFMIITHQNRLWTTRLLLTLYTSFLGLRRTPHSHNNSNKLCLNLYLTPNSYLLIPAKRSRYTAYELIQAAPLYDPMDTRTDLLAANPWISDYLPNYPIPNHTAKRIHGFTGLRLYEKILENILYHLQLWYMRPKLTREYITLDSAFFHPHNPAPKV